MRKKKKNNRPPWWGYVKNIIREYPELKRKLETPLDPKITASTGQKVVLPTKDGGTEECIVFIGGGGLPSKPVEDCVIHDLPRKEQRKFDAVDNAIITTRIKHPSDWKVRMRVIDLVYFQQKTTLIGAALEVGCHSNTAGNYSADFIRIVAEELDVP